MSCSLPSQDMHLSRFSVSRISQLLVTGHVQNENFDRHRKLLGKSEDNSDIENYRLDGIEEVYRLWSFGEGVDKVRIMLFLKNGGVDVITMDTKNHAPRKILLDLVEAKHVKEAMNAMLKHPIVFRKERITATSNGTSYILEALKKNAYEWAVRPVDLTPKAEYNAADQLATHFIELKCN